MYICVCIHVFIQYYVLCACIHVTVSLSLCRSAASQSKTKLLDKTFGSRFPYK